MHEGDDPALLASQFIQQHGIDLELLPILTQQIFENMQEVQEKRNSMDTILNKINNESHC